jgi:hypothetical protein
MKRVILQTTAILLMLAGVVACGKDSNDTVETVNPGVLPSSIDQVVDVIELKYGEEKEWHYNEQVLKFTVTDVEDKLMNCSVMYVPPENQEEFYRRTRMHTYIRVETNNQSVQLKISSQSCWVYDYKNDDTDIQDVWDLLASWQSATNDMGNSLFKEQFLWALGTGTLLENIPCSIYMVKADPIAWELGYNVEKNQYKFIFIITEN